MSGPHLVVDRVSKSYGPVTALSEVSLAVAAHDFVVLLGPSGSGKTTLLSVIGGFTVPTSGTIRIEGEDVTDMPPAQRPTTTVFQDYALFPHMSVAQNIEFGLKLRRFDRRERRRRVDEALQIVGLAGFGQRGIHELSGGQRQRVAVARALVVEPKILLLDEPLGALDLSLRRQMQGELLSLQRRTGRCFIHVTHDQEEAMAMASLIVLMNRGRVEDAGPPQRVYERPATRFTANFMGESAEIPAKARSGSMAETALGPLPLGQDGAAHDGPVTLIIRPENICIDGRGGVSLGEARITEVTFQGAHFRVLARSEINGQTFILRLPPSAAPVQGERLSLSCRASDLVAVPD